jgi:hypothetical protein
VIARAYPEMEIRLGKIQIAKKGVGHVGVIVLASVDKQIVNSNE